MIVDQAVRNQTVQDFGDQWQIHGKVDEDHWSSVDMFVDHFGALFKPEEIAGKTVAEVGSGSGRIVNMICSFRPRKCYAIEPSAGVKVMKAQNRTHAENVKYFAATAEPVDARPCDQ